MQTAIAGFIKGANHYDPGKGAGLRTYATYWIKAELQIEANKQLYLNVPLGLSKEVIAMRKRGDVPKPGKRAHAEDTLKSARDAMSMSFRRVAPDGYGAPGKTRNNGLSAASLSAASPSAASLTETNPQFGVELSDVDAGRLCDYRKMRRLVDRIPSKVQKHCIYHRFYLDQTLEEIGAELGMSREGVRQNIERGLQAMRAMLDMPANDPKAARGKRHAGCKPAGKRAAASLENIMSPLKEDF